MVEFQPSKLAVWVRFPSPAPEIVVTNKFSKKNALITCIKPKNCRE
ncbi:hypothetical protein rpr22_0695 [Rickettsia prowazekii str. Rp22]|uniref:Uncharacterized protein n=1 Tax=Rickettsia prowazekii (strain Rp22) TaxID=449216 RepID=D5AXR6_RICPP|nr:hypothetical protein rpr22_0695 [Rickettsia prowazekii str. Rp22]